MPHILFVDSDGKEVDRIIGFLPPSEYLLRIENIANKQNTLEDYLQRYNNGEMTQDIILAIAKKYEDRKENEKAAIFYSILIKEFPDKSSENYIQAKFFLAFNELKNGNEKPIRLFIEQNSNSDLKKSAYRKLVYYFADTEQQKKELDTYEQMLLTFPNDPGILNSYSWRMAEIELNLENALFIVKKAIALTNDNLSRQANIIDTEAEVLWKMKKYDEAIQSINRAISIDPQNEYFQDQKAKFLESKKNNSQSA